jgi:DNA-binding transcriptional regulator YdaS (Cro superfamily)
MLYSTDGDMHLGEAWQHYGSDLAVAKALGISRQAVHMWRLRGGRVPYARQLELERLTKGALKADAMGKSTAIPLKREPILAQPADPERLAARMAVLRARREQWRVRANARNAAKRAAKAAAGAGPVE